MVWAKIREVSCSLLRSDHLKNRVYNITILLCLITMILLIILIMINTIAEIGAVTFFLPLFLLHLLSLFLSHSCNCLLLGNREGLFYDRVIRWKEAKQKEASLKKQQAERTHITDCTFQPKMNRNSDRAMREIRGQAYAKNSNNSASDVCSVGDRLHRNSEAIYLMRSKAIEEELIKERKEEEKHCTFQPILVDDCGLYSQVRSRFHMPVKKVENQEDEDRFSKSCTFTPKVKICPHSTNIKNFVIICRSKSETNLLGIFHFFNVYNNQFFHFMVTGEGSFKSDDIS